MMKKIFILMFVSLLILSLPAPAYAGWFDKAKDWVDGAADDTKDWVDGAADDTKDWTKEAVKDVSETIDKAFMDNSEQSELDLLPVLNVNLSTMTNVQTDASGTFAYGNNVKQKKLPTAAAEKLKTVLMRDNGFSEYWADFVVNKASELGEEPGNAIVGLLPYSEYYGDRIADVINEAMADNTLSDIDPYKDGIIPVDKLKSTDFVYKVNSKITSNESNTVIVTGVKFGTRDNFTVTVKSGGQEFAAVKKALNGKEIAFVAQVPRVQNLEVVYNSNFKLPEDATVLMHEITADIARSMQKRINNLSPLGDPISNDARDVMEKAIYQGMFAQFEYIAKAKGLIAGDVVTVNDLFANGDVGVIVSDAIKAIPGVETLLSTTGWDEKISKAVRDVVGQAEIRTFAGLNNGKIYINTLNTPEVSKHRLAGYDLYETARKIAEAAQGNRVDNVIVAPGNNWYNALLGSVLSKKFNAPIVLAGSSAKDSQQALDYIKNSLNQGGQVYLIANPNEVDNSFISAVSTLGISNVSVKRIYGANMNNTAVEVAKTLNPPVGGTVIIASDAIYPDALSISSYAATHSAPILITPIDALPSTVVDYLQTLKPQKIIIVGGTGIISSNIENKLKALSSNVIRYAGQDRYETSRIILEKLYGTNINELCFAYGGNYPDALAGSAYAAAKGAPILLVRPGMDETLKGLLSNYKGSAYTVFGGTAVVSDDIFQVIKDSLGKVQ